MSILASLFLWIKALHIIAVISWMSGLLYLPRLFVYHCSAKPGSAQSETFKLMEHRLFAYIMMPAMLASWVFGGLLISLSGVMNAGGAFWFYGKIFFVVSLSVFHVILGKYVKKFASDTNKHNARFYRLINEIPTLIMIIIVILVVVKPF